MATNIYENLYKKLDDIVLVNSGDDDFEEILRLIVFHIWIKRNGFLLPKTKKDYEAILRTIDKQWPGVLKNSETELNLEQILSCNSILEEFGVGSSDYESIDALFEYVVSREKKGSKGQYFTPRYVIDFMTKIVKPTPHESIVDPACGSGAFLFHSYLQEPNQTWEHLWGFDLDNSAIRIAKLLNYVSSSFRFHLFQVNSLLQPVQQLNLFSDEKITTIEDIARIQKIKPLFDVVLTNPPFAGDTTEEEILRTYTLADGKKRIDRDILFIERCVRLLKPGGRMGIVLPDKVFGNEDCSYVRQWLISECEILAVVGLPRNVFMPHTPVKTSIIFLRKRVSKSNRTSDESIIFGISEKPGKDSRGNPIYKNAIRSWKNVDTDLDEIERALKGLFDKEA
ncbi:MAG: N-6 DNA methylase [Bacilli bacterium]|nr:N-6 DNA methylase [Bacilli bacterium]